jgi:hypothetical protein
MKPNLRYGAQLTDGRYVPTAGAIVTRDEAEILIVGNEYEAGQPLTWKLTYFGYQTSQTFLNQAIAHFRKVGPVWLVWPHKTSLKPPEIKQAEIVNRLEFYEYDPRADILDKLRRQLPHGHDIRTIDAQLFRRCEWRAEMEFYCGGSSNFLTHGIGIRI